MKSYDRKCDFLYFVHLKKCAIKKHVLLFNSEALRCDTYWTAALKRGRRLFQSQTNYSCEISKLYNFFFPSNSSRTTLFFPFFHCFYTCSICIFVQLQLPGGQIYNKRYIVGSSAYQRAALILVQVPLGLCLLKCGAYLRPGIYYRKYRSLITKPLALLVKFIQSFLWKKAKS